MKRTKKLLSNFLIIAMVTGLWTALPLTAAAQSIGADIDLTDHTTTSGTDWTYSGGVFIINDGADVTITGTVSDGTRIEVAADATAAVTLNNISITGLAAQQSAITLNSGAILNLDIEGTNAITGGASGAGIDVPTNASIAISGNGTLTATGGDGTGGGGGGAGIGGTFGNQVGGISIAGGTVNAFGGNGSLPGGGGAGIGGGGNDGWNGGAGGNITITGGMVNAIGGDGSGGGAGIGGGGSNTAGGAGGNIAINGGTVTAAGGGGSNGASGANIGAGGTSGSSVAGTASLYLITASAGAGGSISPSGTLGVTLGSYKTYTITPDSGYIIASVTDNGTDVTSQIAGDVYALTNIASDHDIAATFILPGDYGLVFDAGGGATSGQFWLDFDDSHSYTAGDVEYTDQSGAWSWDSGTKTLTLDGFNWTTSAIQALTIVGDATIDLTGTNTFTSTSAGAASGFFSAGIHATNNLIITGTGTLNATAGAAPSASFGLTADASLTFDGGAVNARGGDAASGTSHGIYANIGMTVNGGTVIAAVGNGSSSSHGVDTDNLTLTGGSVSATAGASGNSIGIVIKNSGDASALNIIGGTAEASGSDGAFSIYAAASVSLPSTYTYWTNTIPSAPGGAGTTVPGGAAYSFGTGDKYVKIQVSSAKSLTSVAGQDTSALAATGTIANPITGSINVANGVTALTFADIVYTGVSCNLYSDSGFLTEITGSGTLPLTEGGAAVAYIKVTAQDATAAYYAITINRAAGAMPSVFPSTLNITTGQQGTLTLSFGQGVGAATSATITSNPSGVVTVSPVSVTSDSAITVTGVLAGSATITITWAGGTPVATPTSIQVNVTDAAPTTHTITLNQQTGGTATVSAAIAAKDTPVMLSISSMQPYYSFVRWNITPGVTFTSGSALTASATFTMPDSDVTVIPVYSYNYTGGGGSNYGGGGTYYYNASLSPTIASFDKNPTSTGNRDITITLSSGGYNLNNLKNGDYTLVKDTDYTINGNRVTIKASYLDTLAVGSQTIIFDMSGGTDPALSVTIKDTLHTTDNPTPKPWVNPFADIKSSDWFYGDVQYAYENGLMLGISIDPMLFSPNTNTSRAMIVTILWRLAGSPGDPIPAAAGGGQFADVMEGTYYYQAVNWAVSNGIVSGYGNDEFGPYDSVTREQLATILYRYAVFEGSGPQGMWAIRLNFTDTEDISDWAINGMMYCYMNGIISGYPDGSVQPQGETTRAEVAAMLHRFLELLK